MPAIHVGMKLEFSRQFFFLSGATVSNLMKILSVGAELFHGTDGQTDRRTDGQTDRRTDGQTDRRDEANCRFSQLLNAPKKEYLHYFFNCSYA